MLSSLEVASLISKELNKVCESFDLDYDFNIMAEAGRYDSGYDFNGVLRTVSANPESTVRDNKNTNYVYGVELLCGGVGNCNVEIAQRAVGLVSEKLNGSKYQFLFGTGIITMSEARTKAHNVGIGEDTVIDFEIQINYSENVVTSGDKHWLLDDIEIRFTSESILLEKDGYTKKISEDQYSKTLMTGQTKYYNFEIPFSTQDSLCATLQKDLLLGNFQKQYTLKYYDGVSFTEEAPFLTTVSIFRNANSKSVRPKSSIFNITFADVDDGKGKTKYYFGLCDTPFDNSSNNTRYFEDGGGTTAKEKQIAYWDKKIQNGCVYEEIESPNIDSLDVTQQIYVNNNNYKLFDLVNKNYAVIKVSDPDSTKYYYYFVTNATIGSGNQVIFDLKLDTVQTYFFDPNIRFSDCLINRAHLNRWIDNGDGTVSFDGNQQSKLYFNEFNSDSPKQLMSMYQLTWKYTNNEEIDKWLNENVAYWVYSYVDPTRKYQVFALNGTAGKAEGGIWSSETMGENAESVQNDYGILSCPVYKKSTSKKIWIRYKDKDFIVDSSSMTAFDTGNKVEPGGKPFIYTRKISIMPPFRHAGYAGWSIESKGLIINCENSTDGSINPTISDSYVYGQSRAMITSYGEGSANYKALFGGSIQTDVPLESYPVILDDEFQFSKEELKKNANKKYNPKLLSMDQKLIKLKSFDGSSYDYDLQKLNSNQLTFLYNETLQPEITKYYCRLKAPQGLYVEATNKSYLGLVGSTDTTIAVSQDQYQSFLANNKNFWLQSSFQMMGNLGNDIGRSMVAGSPTGMLGGVISGLGGMMTNFFDKSFMIDNMKEAPDSLKNAGGNILFSSQIKPLTFFLEVHSAIDSILENKNDFNKLFGFSCNVLGDLKKYTNIRKYYNYVAAELNSVQGVLSNNAKADMKQRFQEGIRLWNNDEMRYDLENYERFLDG